MHNVIKVCGRATEMLNKVGLNIGPVPLKVLKPILDGASLEEDEEMQELWAALLANASVEDPNDRRISAAFPEILRQISPQDARLLNVLYEVAKKNNDWADRSVGNSLQIQTRVPGFNQEQLFNCLENLLHLSLLDTDIEVMSGSQERMEFEARERNFAVSPFGARFVLACQLPKKRQ